MEKSNLKIGQKVAWIDPAEETSGVYEVVELYDDYLALIKEGSYAEALYDEIQSLEDTYCCPQCGNIDIQEKGWFFVNSKSTRIVDMVDNASIWCGECDELVERGSVTCEVYLNGK